MAEAIAHTESLPVILPQKLYSTSHVHV